MVAAFACGITADAWGSTRYYGRSAPAENSAAGVVDLSAMNECFAPAIDYLSWPTKIELQFKRKSPSDKVKAYVDVTCNNGTSEKRFTVYDLKRPVLAAIPFALFYNTTSVTISGGNLVGGEQVLFLVAHCGNIEELCLDGVRMQDGADCKGLETLKELLPYKTIEKITFRNTRIGGKGMPVLCEILANLPKEAKESLKEINMENNWIGAKGAMALLNTLAEFPRTRNIITVNLKGTMLDTEAELKQFEDFLKERIIYLTSRRIIVNWENVSHE